MKFDLSEKEFIILKQYVRSKWMIPHYLKIIDKDLFWSLDDDMNTYDSFRTLPEYVERAIIDWMDKRNKK